VNLLVTIQVYQSAVFRMIAVGMVLVKDDVMVMERFAV
jgi:hypothetical protein